jgi:filamentous hemagglutinin
MRAGRANSPRRRPIRAHGSTVIADTSPTLPTAELTTAQRQAATAGVEVPSGLSKPATPPAAEAEGWKGPADYSSIPDPKNVGASTKPTPRQVAAMKAANRAQNGGVLRSDLSGDVMVDSVKSQRGVTPPANEAQIDHKVSVDKGGTRTQSNLQIITRQENRAKWNK